MSKVDVGRPSLLDDKETKIKIRELILQGKSDTDIFTTLSIPESTWNRWKLLNFESFMDVYTTWKHEYMLKIAEINLERLMLSDEEKISLDASNFVSETLGKRHYSKRVENDLTSKGESIIPILGGKTNVSSNDSDTETPQAE
jgi:hypothetical protein